MKACGEVSWTYTTFNLGNLKVSGWLTLSLWLNPAKTSNETSKSWKASLERMPQLLEVANKVFVKQDHEAQQEAYKNK